MSRDSHRAWACLVLGLASSAVAAEPGGDVVARSLAARALVGFRADATLTATGQAPREFTWWRRPAGDGGLLSLLVFRAPAELAGEALLVAERGGVASEAWLYFPRLKKTRHLDGKLLAATLGGGPFGFLAVALSRNPEHARTVARQDACPGSEKKRCPVLVVKGVSGCDTQEEVMDPEHLLPLRVDCLGPRGELTRRTTLAEFQAAEAKGQRLTWPRTITVEEQATHKTTRVEFHDARPDEGGSPEVFTPTGLAGAAALLR